ncbi:hypothetical protein [Candidatus Phytoplasma melaleucae]|uniref:Integral membrane protein n=1 Tax=Candidatus Phytoplasma melaleucae TaxID=2982630 RepID=A0ABT9DED0_9MOLU|nr:hypothetical protein ['Melaleuca sp.' phytoplasma]MDO8168139.1 hypothetical protein ['Melaleuca sp.' phytoplasma]MDV3205233.1 hypothetical protein [Weeping tea tree witches'-broom phytoplasma]
MKKNQELDILQKKLNFSLLEQIVLLSCLSSLSIVLSSSLVLSFYKTSFVYKLLARLGLFDFIKVIPFLVIPLFSNDYFLVFTVVGLSECFSFFLRKSQYSYNPLLSLNYGFCWGVLPILLSFTHETSFVRVYIKLTFICVVHFIIYTLFNFFVFDCFMKYNGSFLSLFRNRFVTRFLHPFLYFRFLTLFLVSAALTHLYFFVRKQILIIFS